MKTFEINTTAFDEENFILTTDLNEKEIVDVIAPIVMSERYGNGYYNNDELLVALKEAYPTRVIIMYQELNTITI
jgi:hypothetical protein